MRLKVGISACLLGDEVRFDGGHKRSPFCENELAKHVEFVKFCPEVGIGLQCLDPPLGLSFTISRYALSSLKPVKT